MIIPSFRFREIAWMVVPFIMVEVLKGLAVWRLNGKTCSGVVELEICEASQRRSAVDRWIYGSGPQRTREDKKLYPHLDRVGKISQGNLENK